jgi:hypothetical protein
LNKIDVGLDATAMFDHVDLKETRRWITPVGKRADWVTAPDPSTHTLVPLVLPVDVLPSGSQCPINGRSTYLQDLGPNDRI